MAKLKQMVDSEGNAIEYKGFPFMSNIDMYVQNELANRALDRVANIVPYIKVTPGFSRDNTVASKIVMKGIESPALKDPSTYEFKELYRPDHFYRPLAGIKSVTIDYKNAMGSIRKATISWVCHTLEDLERLSPYFLNPGYSMFIEWGWSDWAKDVIDNNPPVDLGNYFKYGIIMQKYTHGNYDCMMGVTTNYSFSMNRDGGFDCTTEVISSGWLMEGMTIPNQHTQDATEVRRMELKKKYPNDTKEQIEERIKNENAAEQDTQAKVLRTLQSFLNEEYYAVIKKHSQKFNDINATHDYFILKGTGNTYQGDDKELVDKDEAIKINVKDVYTKQNGESVSLNVSRRAAVYATWGYFEDYILNPYITIEANDKRVLFGFDSRDSKLGYHTHLRTTDLGKCILPNATAVLNGAAPVMDEKRGESVEGEYNFAYARRILINVDYFREVMLSATTVLDGVLQVWSGINDACINYWDLKLKVNEQFFDNSKSDENAIPNQTLPEDRNNIMDIIRNNPTGVFSTAYTESDPLKSKAINKYSIIDVNYASAVLSDLQNNPDEIYVFRTKAFKVKDKNTGVEKEVTSVVKNFTFTSKLSSVAALNVFYSAQNSDGRIFGIPQSNTFKSLYDFSIDGQDYSNAKDTFAIEGLKVTAGENEGITISKDESAKDPGTETETELKEQRAYGDSLVKYLPYKEKGYWVQLGDQQLTGIEGMKMAVQLQDANNSPAISTALVPLDCEVEIQGISGIRIGNIFTVDHLPKIYQNKGVFQIIGITETIDKNGWTTKLKSQFRVFNNINYIKIKGGSTAYKDTLPTGKIARINDIDKSFVLPESKAYIVQRLRDIWTDPSIEGFIASEQILKEAEIIIYKESSARQYNFNVNPPDDSYGLFQINMIKKGIAYYGGVTKYDLYGERTKWTDLGIIKDKSDVHPTHGGIFTHHNLWDIDTNIKVAKRIFKNYGGKDGYTWAPWSTRIYLASNRQTTSLRNEIKIV